MPQPTDHLSTEIGSNISAGVSSPPDPSPLLSLIGHSPSHLHSNPFPQFYWRSHNGDREVLALGVSERIDYRDYQVSLTEAFHRLHERLRSSAHQIPFAVGGTAFDTRPSDRPPSAEDQEMWRDLPWFSFIIPKLLIERRQNTTTFYETTGAHSLTKAIQQQLTLPSEAALARSPDLHLLGVSSPVTKEEWFAQIASITAAMPSNGLSKVVPARRLNLLTTTSPNPASLLWWMSSGFSFGSRFLYAPTPHTAFLGCSPESLLRVSAHEVITDAVAGTFWKQAGDVADLQRKQEEHEVVVDFLVTKLRHFGLSPRVVPAAGRLSVGPFEHFAACVVAPRPADLDPYRLAAALHPTPAVCGYPEAAARSTLAKIEPFSRGWYAGMVGIVGTNEIDLAVGIRSALIRNEHTYLYAGAGCVASSRAQEEYEEIERKMAVPFSYFPPRSSTSS